MKTKRILVIDDDDGLRDIIQISLEVIAEWDVLTAASGTEGIALAQTQQPDAILLDVMMPDMDGVATFKSLQAIPITAKIPTILLTAKGTMNEKQKLIALGITGLIIKPFEAIDLVNQIRTFLDWTE